MNPIQKWIQKQTRPAIEDAYEKGKNAGHLDGFLEAWQAHDVFDTGTADTNHLNRFQERHAYEHHPLFTAAVDTLTSLVLGTGVTYGVMDDPRAQAALEDWYRLNDVENLSKTMFLQWLLDGELLTLIALDASRDEAAWLNIWDTRENPVTVNTVSGNPRLVSSIKAGNRTLKPEGFAWRANAPMFNKARGRSPLTPALSAAEDYSRLMTLRMRAHEIRGRLNAIYYAMVGQDNHAELQRKADRLKKIPRDGNVITLQMDPVSGNSERLEFTNTDTKAADADSDTRTLIRTVAMIVGIPEHYLSVGDTGNRATAESMAEPMLRRVEEHQTFLENYLTELFRKELTRRFGPDATFTVNTSTLNPDGTRVTGTMQVPASELSIPFSFPPVRSDEGHDLERVRFGVEQNLISTETAIEALGFDPALEAERKANDPESTRGGDDDASNPE